MNWVNWLYNLYIRIKIKLEFYAYLINKTNSNIHEFSVGTGSINSIHKTNSNLKFNFSIYEAQFTCTFKCFHEWEEQIICHVLVNIHYAALRKVKGRWPTQHHRHITMSRLKMTVINFRIAKERIYLYNKGQHAFCPKKLIQRL